MYVETGLLPFVICCKDHVVSASQVCFDCLLSLDVNRTFVTLIYKLLSLHSESSSDALAVAPAARPSLSAAFFS